jgi:hypothetical protein
MGTNILLTDEQKDLLTQLVERYKNLPKDKRERFYFFRTDRARPILTGRGQVRHDHTAWFDASQFDINELISQGLLASDPDSKTLTFVLRAEALRYFEEMKEEMGQPVEQITGTIRAYLDTAEFQRRHPRAYEKWAEAESLLWSADSDRQFTTIGHLCREAIQEFASELVDRFKPPQVDTVTAHDKNRVGAVLELHRDKLGSREKEFLNSLATYWSAVSDLIQRQEHGDQKGGSELIMEDGRRVVFQAALVMFEVDRSLSRFQ